MGIQLGALTCLIAGRPLPASDGRKGGTVLTPCVRRGCRRPTRYGRGLVCARESIVHASTHAQLLTSRAFNIASRDGLSLSASTMVLLPGSEVMRTLSSGTTECASFLGVPWQRSCRCPGMGSRVPSTSARRAVWYFLPCRCRSSIDAASLSTSTHNGSCRTTVAHCGWERAASVRLFTAPKARTCQLGERVRSGIG